jgi:hypothetical protein
MVVENNAKAKDDTLISFKLKNGQQAAKIQAQEGTIAEIMATDDAVIKDRETKLGLKESELEGAQDAYVELQISFTDSLKRVHRGDTIAIADHKDSFNNFHEVIKQDSTTGKLTIAVNDTPIVPLHLTEYSPKKSFIKKITHPFQPAVHMVSAYSDNRNAKITGLESVLVVKEQPKTIPIIEAIAAGLIGGLLLHTIIH